MIAVCCTASLTVHWSCCLIEWWERRKTDATALYSAETNRRVRHSLSVGVSLPVTLPRRQLSDPLIKNYWAEQLQFWINEQISLSNATVLSVVVLKDVLPQLCLQVALYWLPNRLRTCVFFFFLSDWGHWVFTNKRPIASSSPSDRHTHWVPLCLFLGSISANLGVSRQGISHWYQYHTYAHIFTYTALACSYPCHDLINHLLLNSRLIIKNKFNSSHSRLSVTVFSFSLFSVWCVKLTVHHLFIYASTLLYVAVNPLFSVGEQLTTMSVPTACSVFMLVSLVFITLHYTHHLYVVPSNSWPSFTAVFLFSSTTWVKCVKHINTHAWYMFTLQTDCVEIMGHVMG